MSLTETVQASLGGGFLSCDSDRLSGSLNRKGNVKVANLKGLHITTVPLSSFFFFKKRKSSYYFFAVNNNLVCSHFCLCSTSNSVWSGLSHLLLSLVEAFLS